MAKQNYLKLALVIVLTMAAASSVCAAVVTLTGTTSIGGTSFAASNKVNCYYVSALTGGTAGSATPTAFDGTSYGIACGHQTGDKITAAISGDAKLYFATTTAGNATAGASAITTSSSSTWTSM